MARMISRREFLEGSLADLLTGKYTSHAHPESVLGNALAITVDYGIPVFFCSNRQAACRFVQGYLSRECRLRTGLPAWPFADLEMIEWETEAGADDTPAPGWYPDAVPAALTRLLSLV